MKKEEMIESEIKKTMDLLENKTELAPDPYFYTKIKARLEERNKKQIFSFYLKPALFSVLLLLNITSAVWYLSPQDTSSKSSSREKFVKVLSEDLKNNSNNNLFQF